MESDSKKSEAAGWYLSNGAGSCEMPIRPYCHAGLDPASRKARRALIMVAAGVRSEAIETRGLDASICGDPERVE